MAIFKINMYSCDFNLRHKDDFSENSEQQSIKLESKLSALQLAIYQKFWSNVPNNFKSLSWATYILDMLKTTYTQKTNHINDLEEIYAPCGQTAQEGNKGLNWLKVSGNSALYSGNCFHSSFLFLSLNLSCFSVLSV